MTESPSSLAIDAPEKADSREASPASGHSPTGVQKRRRAAGNPRQDRRTQRTQRTLQTAFFQLIRQHGYENVSVAQVVAAANVGRSTFYEHYRSKEDMLRASMRQFFQVLADTLVTREPSEALKRVLEHLWENRKLADQVFSGVAGAVITRQHVALIDERLTALTRGSRRDPAVPTALTAVMIAEMQLAALRAWLTGKVRGSVEGMTAALHASTRAVAASRE